MFVFAVRRVSSSPLGGAARWLQPTWFRMCQMSTQRKHVLGLKKKKKKPRVRFLNVYLEMNL